MFRSLLATLFAIGFGIFIAISSFAAQAQNRESGPDKKFDPGTRANAGVNKDNVLSWK